ncbi:MAG TPA: flagellin [Planctomicrobium sp.]|nr:flagellin [Planctomicrobium sp.]
MALTIANNVTSLNAQTNLGKASSALATSVERLSSGLKINRGADGPAALVISEKQRAQIAGLKQAIDNSNKAVSLVQTAEGALGEINALLVKVRSLALDSANAAVNDDDALAANQAEINNALDTINRISSNTQFGTKKLLDGSAGTRGTASDADVTFLKGTTDTVTGSYAVAVTTVGERANVTAGTGQTGPLATAETLTVNGVAIQLDAGFSQSQVVDRINEFTDQTGVIADVDGGDLRLYTEEFGSAATISVQSNVAAAATSSGVGVAALTDTGVDIIGTIDGVTITGVGNVLKSATGDTKGIEIRLAADADPVETVTGAQGTVDIVNDSLIFQIGPNQNQTAQISINKVDAASLGMNLTGNQFANLAAIDVTSASKAQDAIGVIDQAINDVTNLRGELGAFQQNTLSSTANNLRTTLENTTNAESVIRDTDFAAEIAEFTKNQVLVQAGTSILANANQIPQQILSLLR